MTTAVDGAGLLRAIIAEPKDDALRLIYADWLCDRGGPGDAERAEFIRKQIRREFMSRWPWRMEWLPDLFQGKVMLAHGTLRHTSDVVCRFANDEHVVYRHGFVHTVRCPLAAWLRHGAALRAAHPLLRVELSDRRPWAMNGLGDRVDDDRDAVRFGWFGQELNDECDLPFAVWRLLGGHNEPENTGTFWKEYGTREAANDALSDALLALFPLE